MGSDQDPTVIAGISYQRPNYPVPMKVRPQPMTPQQEVSSEQIKRERDQMRHTMQREQGWLV